MSWIVAILSWLAVICETEASDPITRVSGIISGLALRSIEGYFPEHYHNGTATCKREPVSLSHTRILFPPDSIRQGLDRV